MSVPDSERFKFCRNPVRGRRAIEAVCRNLVLPPIKKALGGLGRPRSCVPFGSYLAQAILQRRGLGIERAQWF